MSNYIKNIRHLQVDDIKTLVVDDKWMQTIETSVKSEVTQISQHLSNRIKELSECYESPLPIIVKEVEEMESKMSVHLQKMGFVWK
jgi:type I restriction enzyme M protein